MTDLLTAAPPDTAVDELAAMFGVLADPGRLRLLTLLHAGGETCVGDLAAAAGMSESAVSHALRLLRDREVVQARRDGRLIRYSLADAHVRSLLELGLDHVGHGGPTGGAR
jgi:ArsR family transcriptional regulator, lead/cadmium/zinc/bismuth-responsive transcriptional repressor